MYNEVSAVEKKVNKPRSKFIRILSLLLLVISLPTLLYLSRQVQDIRRKAQESEDPTSGVTTFTYDGEGQRLSKTDENGVTTWYPNASMEIKKNSEGNVLGVKRNYYFGGKLIAVRETETSVCGNQVVERGEQCDPPGCLGYGQFCTDLNNDKCCLPGPGTGFDLCPNWTNTCDHSTMQGACPGSYCGDDCQCVATTVTPTATPTLAPNITPTTPPTAIFLDYFQGKSTQEGVLVEWGTAQELDCLGFNLYRSLDSNTTGQKINSKMIVCQNPGSVIPGNYKYLDTQAEPSTINYYKLEGISLDGTTEQFGPIEVDHVNY